MSRNWRKVASRRGLAALAVLSLITLGTSLAATPAVAGSGSFPMAFNPETTPGYTVNTYTTKDVLTPACPQALAGTPGSDPASKVINTGPGITNTFAPGGVVHYTYLDDPHTNGGTQNFTIQDCEVVYPANFFKMGDFNASGQLINSAITKQALSQNGTQVDGASLSGIVTSSVGNIYFTWTVPADVTAGWVCNFARDIRNNHGGGGNRKVPPTCFQITGGGGPNPNVTPAIWLGYADELHNGTGTMFVPWAGDPANEVFLGCTIAPMTGGCFTYDSGAIRIDNPPGNTALTLTTAYVDISTSSAYSGTPLTCRFQIWGSFLPATVNPGQDMVLTQTGSLGPPQPAQCARSVDPTFLSMTNFDTSEGPLDYIDNNPNPNTPHINCDKSLIAPPAIHLIFTSGTTSMTLDITDSAFVLDTGGTDRFGCTGGDEAMAWTLVPASQIVSS